MKITIITAVYNCHAYISDCIASVLGQDYPDVEYIVVNGMSTDGTTEIIEKFRGKISQVINEPDNGMYDAMNKGLAKATGDIIGILNADDFYPNPTILSQIIAHFHLTGTESLYGDIQFVSQANPSKIVRHYSSRNFKPWKFRFGYMPAHLSFFAKRQVYETNGFFKIDYRLCADFDLILRLLYVKKITSSYLSLVMVHMRMGGRSNKSLKAVWTLNKEILRACGENGIRTNLLFIYLKYFTKVFELLLP
jgi:glycosyltransferase involved in cell wall biosynthesis